MKNVCLITGCGSFIGSHLVELLLEMGMRVYGMVHRDSRNIDHLKDWLTILGGDILDKERVESTVAWVNPDFVFHLAAQSLPRNSWREPEETLKVNILGTLYLLEGIRKAGFDPVIEIAGSSGEYGFCDKDDIPIKETREFRPLNPYGVSKVAEDMLSLLYSQTYGMKVIRLRPFYITGPRKTSDVCSDFARGIVAVERGRKAALDVGNLENIREVLDVRDCVAAMWLLAEKGTPGDVYNICSGEGYMIKDILDKLISLSQCDIEVRQDSDLMRPSDEPVLVGDNSKLRQLGWAPQIPIEKTLSDILDYWRENK